MAETTVTDDWTRLLAKGHSETLYTVDVGSGSDIYLTTKQDPAEPQQGIPVRSNDVAVVPKVEEDEPLFARAQTSGASVNVRVVGGINVQVVPRKVVSADVNEPVQIENPNDGSAINPASEASLTSTQPRSVTSDATREIGKARMQDSSGVLIDPAENMDGASASASAAGTGSANAAAISVPNGCRTVTVAYDTSGAATITVEVSPDGGTTWYPLTSYSPGSAAANADTVETGFDDVRAYIDANLNSLHVGAKGV